MRIKHVIFVGIALFASLSAINCKSNPFGEKIGKLQHGMSREQAVAALGNPDHGSEHELLYMGSTGDSALLIQFQDSGTVKWYSLEASNTQDASHQSPPSPDAPAYTTHESADNGEPMQLKGIYITGKGDFNVAQSGEE